MLVLVVITFSTFTYICALCPTSTDAILIYTIARTLIFTLKNQEGRDKLLKLNEIEKFLKEFLILFQFQKNHLSGIGMTFVRAFKRCYLIT